MSNNSNTPSLNLQSPPEKLPFRKRLGKWFGYKSVKRTPLTKKSGKQLLVPARPIHKRVWSGIRGLAGKTKKQINAKLHDPLVVKYTHKSSSNNSSIESGSNISTNSNKTIRPSLKTKKFKPGSRLKINLPETPLDIPAPRFGFKDIFTDTIHDILGDKNKYIEKLYKFKVAEYEIIYNPNARHMVLVIGKNNFYRFTDIYDEKIKAQLDDSHKNALENAITLLKSKHIRYDMQGKYYYFLQGEHEYTAKHSNKDRKAKEYGTLNIQANVHALQKFVDAINNAFAYIKTPSKTDA